MAEGRDTNYHFKQLTAGAPADVLTLLGEALLAVDAQRRGQSIDAPSLLRQAWLKLARWLIRTVGAELNHQQRAFLLGGAVADSVAVKRPDGEVAVVELLPAPVFEGLLSRLDNGEAQCLLGPLRRMAALATGELTPLDLSRPGRYREPDASVTQRQDPAQLQDLLRQALRELENEKRNLSTATRELAGMMQAERLKPTLQAAGELGRMAEEVLACAGNPAGLADYAVPREVEDHQAVIAAQTLRENTGQALAHLAEVELSLLRRLRQARAAAEAVSRAAVGREPVLDQSVVLDESATRLVESDYDSLNTIVTQSLINSPQRTAWSASRVLLAEHTEKCDDPLAQCYATPSALAQSIAKIDALHPNCFPRDAAGRPVLPPLVIEPGVDIVQWYDDRFVMGFVCTEGARKGSRLSLSPLDSAVLKLFGQYVARGELYTYRGERARGNFAADYAGEVESKAKVKFTGEKKKMTIVSATEIKDAAGREEAVRDYIDFVFHTFNDLALPKRITPRRVGVILRYCVIGDPARTAALVLKYVANHDLQRAREILNNLADKDEWTVVQLIESALKEDPRVASRYHGDPLRAVADVMGRDFAESAKRKEQRSAEAAAEPAAEEPSAEEPAAPGHDYFDV